MPEEEMGKDILIRGAHVILPDKMKPILGDILIIDGIIEDIHIGGKIGSRKVRGLEIIDAEGCVASPPFFDGHMHFHQWSISSSCVDLSHCRSMKKVLSLMREVEAGDVDNTMFNRTGTLIGVDMDDSLFRGPGKIDGRVLNNTFPDNPVLIRRICGHKAYANDNAMDLLDISDTARVNGVLLEGDAMSSTSQFSPTGKTLENILKVGRDKLYAMGVIGGVEIINEGEIDVFNEGFMGMGGGLRLVLSIVPEDNKIRGHLNSTDMSWSDPPQADIREDQPPPILFSKIFMDGSIGAGTASFHKRYTDGNRVDPIISKRELIQLFAECSDKGMIPMIHAIGDRAISQVVDVVDNDQCVRIEHAEGCNGTLIGRMERREIALCVQPNFQRKWGKKGEMYESKLGEMGLSLNPVEDLIKSEIPVCFGTDMMPPDPIYGIFQNIPWEDHGTASWKNSVINNLRKFTSEAMRLSFAGGSGFGNIAKGMKADIMLIGGRDGLIREILLNGDRKIIDVKI
ncbi:MAG: amidohydrolase family protein [Thermoplasmata archaeon]|nr:amidohydrolase family protein [Thermoplasmata archaeon]